MTDPNGIEIVRMHQLLKENPEDVFAYIEHEALLKLCEFEEQVLLRLICVSYACWRLYICVIFKSVFQMCKDLLGSLQKCKNKPLSHSLWSHAVQT